MDLNESRIVQWVDLSPIVYKSSPSLFIFFLSFFIYIWKRTGLLSFTFQYGYGWMHPWAFISHVPLAPMFLIIGGYKSSIRSLSFWQEYFIRMLNSDQSYLDKDRTGIQCPLMRHKRKFTEYRLWRILVKTKKWTWIQSHPRLNYRFTETQGMEQHVK